MEESTFIYCRPGVLHTSEGITALNAALDTLAVELNLGKAEDLRAIGSTSIIVRGHGPDETWDAIDRVLPIFKQNQLFYMPRNH
ncbi:MAG TPA: hypothetical protein VGI73_14285 [Solirubrobacterales bacterium]